MQQNSCATIGMAPRSNEQRRISMPMLRILVATDLSTVAFRIAYHAHADVLVLS
jgi:hypothetical protein